MMREIFEYHNLVKQLNEEHILIFDDIIYAWKKIVPWHTINLFIFLQGGDGIGKTFTLNLIIQGLL